MSSVAVCFLSFTISRDVGHVRRGCGICATDGVDNERDVEG